MATVTVAVLLATRSIPTGVVYSVLLLLHVGCAVVGFAAVILTGVQASRARRGPHAPGADGTRRYFRPGVNWAARALYGVPVFGFALVSASGGDFAVNDGFVLAGLGLWALAAVVAEVVVWPAERRIQAVVADRWDTVDGARALARDSRLVSVAAVALVTVFVAAVALMVARP